MGVDFCLKRKNFYINPGRAGNSPPPKFQTINHRELCTLRLWTLYCESTKHSFLKTPVDQSRILFEIDTLKCFCAFYQIVYDAGCDSAFSA